MSSRATRTKRGAYLFTHNENIAHVMSCVTARAMTSYAHRMACARRQAGHPNYTWHARIYLWCAVRAG